MKYTRKSLLLIVKRETQAAVQKYKVWKKNDSSTIYHPTHTSTPPMETTTSLAKWGE